MIPLAACLILMIPSSQDDLVDRLKTKLKTLSAAERHRVLDRLEALPITQRRKAAEEFLSGGRRQRPAPEACMARMAVKMLEGVNHLWERLPSREKLALTKEAMSLYEALPPEIKQEIMKEIQREFLKSVLPPKKNDLR